MTSQKERINFLLYVQYMKRQYLKVYEEKQVAKA